MKLQQKPTDKPTAGPPTILDPDDPLYKRAIRELGIDRPVYYCRVVGSRLEFHLVGGDGDVAVWQPRERKR